ncbi:MAG: tetratricopeptide repeat protein [Acidobacteriota bacterium]
MGKTIAAIVLVVLGAGCASSGSSGRGAAPAGAPGESLALVSQAQLRLQSGEISEGLQLFRQALKLAPDDRELIEEYGLALAAVGLDEEAVKHLLRAAGLSGSGEATLGVLLAQSAAGPKEVEAAIPHLLAGLDAEPNGQHCRFILVQALVGLGRGEEAWTYIGPLLADRPDDPRLQFLGGQALRQAKRSEEAVELLKKAAQHPETRARATFELVELLAATGDFRQAADLMGVLVKHEGATLAALTRWATLLLRAGDREQAEAVLDDVLERDPSFREAVLTKALLAARDGRLDGAEQLYRRALAANPEDADAAFGLIRVLMDQRRLGEARTLLDGLWAQIEKAKLELDEAGIEVVQERATVELLDHAGEAALPWLRRLPAAPIARRPLALWAEYHRLRGAYREGIEFLAGLQVEDVAETRRLHASLLAEFRLAAGDEEGAKVTLATLAAGGEEDTLAALGALERRKRHAESVELARRALERFPEAKGILFAYAGSLERSGAWDEAVQQFRALLAKAPEHAAALNYLGYMFADRGVHLEEARELLTKAVALDPTSGAFQDSLGWVYFRLGELDRAEKHLAEAVRLEPFDATVQEHMGDLYHRRGLRDEARAAYLRALEFEPDESGQKERIEEKLKVLATDAIP